jgi:hypothetical protein
MLSVAKNALRPTLSRAFGAGKVFKHTLPPLPYAYNVSCWFVNDLDVSHFCLRSL